MSTPHTKRRTGKRRGGGADPAPLRNVNYRNLRNPFPPMDVFSADRIAAMHETSLRTLEELGVKVLLPEAIEVFRKAGAHIEDQMVYIGRDIIEAALASAPKSITGRAGTRHRDVLLELGKLDDVAFKELGYADWSEDNQRSSKNNPYIYQAIMDVLRRHSPPVGRFKASTPAR